MSGQICEPGISRIQSSSAHNSVKGEVLADIYILQYVRVCILLVHCTITYDSQVSFNFHAN